MDEEYQKFEEEQNNQNEVKDCNCDENCDCGCQNGEPCTCGEEEYEYCDCGCSKTEKLFVVSAVANILTTIFAAVIMGLMIYNTVSAPAGVGNARVQKQPEQREIKPLFKDKTMTLDEAMKKDKYVAVLFYADWCPHCRNFAPTFNKLSKNRKLSKTYNFVRVNSEEPSSRAKMEEFNVQGFPALYLVNPKTGEKQFISNSLLFVDEAEDTLVDIFNGYADSRNKK